MNDTGFSQNASSRPQCWQAAFLLSLLIAGCSGGGNEPPALPAYVEKPTAVRISETKNRVSWDAALGEIYTLTWRRAGTRGEAINQISSPFVHELPNNDEPVYYRLNTRETAPGPESFSVVFDARPFEQRIYTTVTDVNGDGCLEVLFSLNDCAGNLMAMTAEQMGIEKVRQSGRALRDLRLADFNGDSIPDLVANSYEEHGPDAPPALLFFGTGGGRFVADPAFESINARGQGETIVVADFDNDGDLDIYLPYYTHTSSEAQSYLLINDGSGHFTDTADTAGVALRNVPNTRRVEGVQALDFDFDGDIDLAASTELFINQLNESGELVFRSFNGFPPGFDEGLKFLDWDNDGDLDVIRQRPHRDIGPVLFEFENGAFSEVVGAFPLGMHSFAFGLNIYDVNYDGREDVITGSGRGEPGEDRMPNLYINSGDGFVKHAFVDGGFGWSHDVSAFADFNQDGMIDIVARLNEGLYLVNQAQLAETIRILVLGQNGEQNQQGRTVRLFPDSTSGVVMTRVVDGGSGYLSNNQYELIFGLPEATLYRVEVQFADRLVSVAGVAAGERLVIKEDGRVERE